MRAFLMLGMIASGCLVVLGVVASLSIVGLVLGWHWILAGGVGLAAFSVARKLLR